MLADTTRDDDRPGIEERYGNAIAATSLRLHRTDEDTQCAADLIIAAGMSQATLGLALLRLHTEWTAAAKPKRMPLETIKANAAKIREADETERANRERENGELARLEALLETAEEGQRFDLMVAIMDQRRLYEAKKLPIKAPQQKGTPEARARAEGSRWYGSELRLLVQGLRSRANVLPALMVWAAEKEIPEAAVSAGLLHWLDPTCGHCDGHGLLKAKDAPALSAKQCRHCNATGTKPMQPHAGRVLSHISQCVSDARTSIQKRLRR